MNYPHFKNKHLGESLIHPLNIATSHKLKWQSKNKPKKYIFVYYPYLTNYFKKKYKPKKIEIYRLITVYQHKDIALVQMTGIGAPNAVTVMEELIPLGAKQFLNIGTAGGLGRSGIFLCNKAIRDEGTSHHYLKLGKYSYPNKTLTRKLGKSMNKFELDFKEATTWTIDAPFMETKEEIKHYKKQGVKTVEMEASALFTVGKIRNVNIASAFVVSDILGEDEWTPQFHQKWVKNNLKKLLDAAVDCLK
jgi:uridine phosphorylase